MYYVGIDVGGTNLKAGLVDEQGRLLAAERCPLDYRDPESFAKTVADLARAAAEKGGVRPEELKSVGMGLPGTISGGDILFTTNIPMKNVPIAKLFRQHLDVPLYLGNDADCAAVGEYFCGAGQGKYRDMAMITLGTGVGCGLILDGKLRGGPISSEGGHMTIVHGGDLCNCGRRGCWERYASATALIRITREHMAEHPESILHRLAAEGGVEGKTPFQAAEQGDETALAVCREYVGYLADGVIGLVNLLRPEAVAIGGGVAAAPERLLLEPLREQVLAESYIRYGGLETKIVRAELGNDAGILGAALLEKVS